MILFACLCFDWTETFSLALPRTVMLVKCATEKKSAVLKSKSIWELGGGIYSKAFPERGLCTKKQERNMFETFLVVNALSV